MAFGGPLHEYDTIESQVFLAKCIPSEQWMKACRGWY